MSLFSNQYINVTMKVGSKVQLFYWWISITFVHCWIVDTPVGFDKCSRPDPINIIYASVFPLYWLGVQCACKLQAPLWINDANITPKGLSWCISMYQIMYCRGGKFINLHNKQEKNNLFRCKHHSLRFETYIYIVSQYHQRINPVD